MRDLAAERGADASLKYSARRVEVEDLLDVVDACSARPLFYGENPERGEAVLGLGSAAAIITSGGDRFSRAEHAAGELFARLVPDDEHDPAGPHPRLIGGFGFSPQPVPVHAWREFPPCWLALPSELWVRSGEQTWCVRIVNEPEAARAPLHASRELENDAGARATATVAEGAGGWNARVRRVLDLIERGAVEKVVLARHETRVLDADADVASMVRRLRGARPGCYTFWVSPSETHFFGSTPETLVRVTGLQVETQALAGTAARGDDDAEDEAAARTLLASAKNRREQEAVARHVRERLEPIAAAVDAAAEPGLLTVPEAHHLVTPVHALLKRRASALALAGILHPTPAVCGTPQREANEIIEADERDRGWYTGAVGWINAHGDGAFAVALRAGVADGRWLMHWAGAGIVAGSSPAAELEETEIKLRAVRRALEAEP